MEPYPSTSAESGSLGGALAAIAAMGPVREAVVQARQACDGLRGHPMVRTRPAQVRTEAGVWAAWATARLEGVDLPVDLVRRAASGGPLPDDATGLVVAGALRAVAEADQAAASRSGLPARSPRQFLARLHLAAAGRLEPEEALGRPRADVPAERLAALIALLAASDAPALLVAALVDAEICTLAPFATSNAVVARAAARAVVISRGLDPTGAVVPEVAMLEGDRVAALQAYRSGTAEGVARWVESWARWVVAGAAHGRLVADSIGTGRPLRT